MARHRRIITRDDLLHRYANALNLTYGDAHDRHGGTPIEQLRDMVETVEQMNAQPFPRRRSFARSQPTTTVQGQTR